MVNTPTVAAATNKPVTIVTIIDVCLGLNPKRDMRRLPTLVPNLSPM